VRGAASRRRGRGRCRSGTTPGPARCAPACAWPTTARRARTRRSGTPSASCAAPSSPTSWCSSARTATAGARARPTT
jgi:hypothetical protein